MPQQSNRVLFPRASAESATALVRGLYSQASLIALARSRSATVAASRAASNPARTLMAEVLASVTGRAVVAG